MHEKPTNTFVIRGANPTRLETFTDAAFAFAITMLVISVGSVPKDYQELIIAIKKVPSFALSFAGVIWFWVGHRKWSRWYGLENSRTILLTFALIFIMLVYIYPLRLIFSAMLSWISGNYFPSEFNITKAFELTDLFVFYGIGFFALTGIVAMLYKYALSKKDEISLSNYEQIKTRAEIAHWLLASVTGLLSALFALIMPLHIGVYAGFFYTSMAITMPMVSVYYSRS